MTKRYYFYRKQDDSKEPIGKSWSPNRLAAAKKFASRKLLSLKTFLKIWSVSR